MEEQKEIEEINQTQQPSWLVKILFCSEGETHTQGIAARENTKENRSNKKEAYTDRSKNTGRKVGFTAEFTGITRTVALPEEASIHTAEITIKIAMRVI